MPSVSRAACCFQPIPFGFGKCQGIRDQQWYSLEIGSKPHWQSPEQTVKEALPWWPVSYLTGTLLGGVGIADWLHKQNLVIVNGQNHAWLLGMVLCRVWWSCQVPASSVYSVVLQWGRFWVFTQKYITDISLAFSALCFPCRTLELILVISQRGRL